MKQLLLKLDTNRPQTLESFVIGQHAELVALHIGRRATLANMQPISGVNPVPEKRICCAHWNLTLLHVI